MTDLRFLSVRSGTDTAVELVFATLKGALRTVELSNVEALQLIRDVAGFVLVESRSKENQR